MNANDLKQWRERLGLTQEQAAEALGLSRPTIARYECDNDIPLVVEYACNYLSLLKSYKDALNENGNYRQYGDLHKKLIQAKEQLLGIKNHGISVEAQSLIGEALIAWIRANR